MRDRIRAFALFALGASGCAPPFQSRLPDVQIAPARMVVLPATVKVYEVDMNDDRTEVPDKTDAVRDNVDAAVRAQAAARGLRVFARELDGQDQMTKSLFGRLWRWSAKTSLEIAAQQTGRRDFGRRSVGDWRFPGNVAPLGTALQGDTALTIFVSDTGQSIGRSIVSGMAGGYMYWKKIGVACLVSLRDGRMLRCETKVDAWGDLKDPRIASAAVGELFAGLADAAPNHGTK